MAKLLYKIESEYSVFRDCMIKKSREEIWEKCHQIYFYSSIHEYFIYNHEIPMNIVEALSDYDNVIAECWQLYLKKEELSIFTWNEITVLLEQCAKYLNERALKMNYEEFEKAICEELLTRMEGIRIQSQKVMKNNSIELKGIAIMEQGSNVSPTIYLEKYYEDYMNGTDIHELAERIEEFHKQKQYKGNLDIKELQNWEKTSSKIFCKLINKDKNKELLKEIPYISWCDLAIVFSILLDKEQEGMATILINNNFCKWWNKSSQELMEVAAQNTIDLFPPMHKPLNEIIKKRLGSMDMLYNCDDNNMVVISNEIMSNGAIALLYPDILPKIAEELQSDLYIIPSSVHEWIVMPAFSCNKLELLDMVKDVNEKSVLETEFLSNNVYYYDRKKSILHMYSSDMPEMEVDMENAEVF